MHILFLFRSCNEWGGLLNQVNIVFIQPPVLLTVSLSSRTVNSFLMVDIKKTAEIFQITIFNRIDHVTAMRRLKNFSIFIGKTLGTFKNFVTNEDVSSNIEKTFKCHFVGRYVKIQSHIAEWFHLCEVVIIGRYVSSLIIH